MIFGMRHHAQCLNENSVQARFRILECGLLINKRETISARWLFSGKTNKPYFEVFVQTLPILTL